MVAFFLASQTLLDAFTPVVTHELVEIARRGRGVMDQVVRVFKRGWIGRNVTKKAKTDPFSGSRKKKGKENDDAAGDGVPGAAVDGQHDTANHDTVTPPVVRGSINHYVNHSQGAGNHNVDSPPASPTMYPSPGLLDHAESEGMFPMQGEHRSNIFSETSDVDGSRRSRAPSSLVSDIELTVRPRNTTSPRDNNVTSPLIGAQNSSNPNSPNGRRTFAVHDDELGSTDTDDEDLAAMMSPLPQKIGAKSLRDGSHKSSRTNAVSRKTSKASQRINQEGSHNMPRPVYADDSDDNLNSDGARPSRRTRKERYIAPGGIIRMREVAVSDDDDILDPNAAGRRLTQSRAIRNRTSKNTTRAASPYEEIDLNSPEMSPRNNNNTSTSQERMSRSPIDYFGGRNTVNSGRSITPRGGVDSSFDRGGGRSSGAGRTSARISSTGGSSPFSGNPLITGLRAVPAEVELEDLTVQNLRDRNARLNLRRDETTGLLVRMLSI